jgi:hypothetical protein
MTANPIPGLFVPARSAPLIDDPQVSKSLLGIQQWAKSVSPRIWAVGSPIKGSNPPSPPSDAYISQIGRYNVNLTSGTGTLTLSHPFPNGWLSLSLNGGYSFQYSTFGVTLQAITISVVSGPTATVPVDVQAIGW